VGQFDVIDVTGTASLDGTLNVICRWFVPAQTDTFQIPTAGSVKKVRSPARQPFEATVTPVYGATMSP
jgi:hypothetical protein